jgi:hypothetical protein
MGYAYGIMHCKLTAGCQILTLLLGFWRDPINITCKIAKGRQSSFPRIAYIKIVREPSNDLIAWWDSAPQATTGCQISTLIVGFMVSLQDFNIKSFKTRAIPLT